MQFGAYIKTKSILGEKHPDTIRALGNLAYAYFYLGDYKKSFEIKNKVYNMRKELLGDKHPDTLETLRFLAILYSDLGDYRKALELNKIVYNSRKEILGDKHPDTLIALANLAGIYNKLGNYKKSLELFETVYTEMKNQLGENHPGTIRALGNLAISYGKMGNYHEELELNDEAYIQTKSIFGEKHPDTLDALGNLANSYCALGDYDKGFELQNKVYTARKDLFGENHPDTLTSLANLAVFCGYLGEYKKELELQNEVYNARKKLLGEKHPDTLNALNNLGSTYSELGDYNKSFEIRNKVYNMRKELLGDKHPDTLSALNNLGNTYSDLGDYNKALELQNTVYNAFKGLLGENHPDTLSALNNLGSTYSDLGDHRKALEIKKVVYKTSKEILGENHPDTLTRLSNLGLTYSDLGDYSKALEVESSIYDAISNRLGENHPFVLIILSNLSYCHKMLKNYDEALKCGTVAYERLKKILGKKHSKTLLALSNLLAAQINKDRVNDESIRENMTAYFENINNLKATAFNIKEVSSRRYFLKTFNDVYKLLKTSVFERSVYDLLDYLFINKNLSFEIDVNRFHNETMSERLSLEEVSLAIGNHLIIDFYELNDSKYGLILIKDGKYSYFVADYSDIINGSFINNKNILSFIGSLEDYDHIYICPDGKLYNISFERVFNCSNISYLSSVQTLFKKNTDDDNTNQLVSFVYPDFSGRLSDDNDRGDTVGVLYGSYLEGIFIHDIYGEKSTIYSSYQANYDNFLNTKRPRILHVSTHGDYLDNEHMEPMDRGILCLSGYNVDENDSGYISAREIQYMDLKGTELAVLSACNTGLGENISGEGIYGIRRAFELAGCQTLLLTVEEVDDFNSAIFMKVFYERYNETNNIYQSFKDTKEYLKEHGLKELRELRDVFEEVMKNKINSRIVYTRNLKELNNRIEESEKRGQIVRKKNGEYVVEDWNGFIIQGKIENS